MNKFSKIIANILIVIMISNCFQYNVLAASTNNEVSTSAQATQSKDKAPKIISEVKDKREENTKVFLKDDMSYEAEVYPQAVHYNDNGTWKDIDNSLVQQKDENNQDVLANKANSFSVKFAKNLNSNKLVNISQGKYSISWGIGTTNTGKTNKSKKASKKAAVAEVRAKSDETKQIEAEVDNIISKDSNLDKKSKDQKTQDKNILIQNEKTKTLDNVASTVDFKNVFDNVDLSYNLAGDSLKENIVIKKATDNPEYSFNINVKNLTAKLQSDNSITFYDEKDNKTEVFNMKAPYMFDAKKQLSDNIKLSLTKNEKGYTLKMNPDKQWLNSSGRAYPVTIDPDVFTSQKVTAITDTFVCSNDASDKWNNILLRVGQTPNVGATRSLIKFTLPQLNAGDMVTYAKLGLAYNDGGNGSTQINAHKVTSDWTSSGTVWSNQPGYNTTIVDYGIINGANANGYSWDITSIAKEWYNTGNNYGLMLKANNENTGYASFISSDCGNQYINARPVALIQYRNNSGLESYLTYHSQDVHRAGTGYINDYDGNLVFQHDDLSMTGNKMPALIKHFYNSNDRLVNRFDKIGNNVTALYGTGWRLNINQRILPVTINNAQWYKYVDEDGTQHYFYYDSASSKYKDESGLNLTLTTGYNNGYDAGYCITDSKDNKIVFLSGGFLYKIIDSNNNTISFGYNGAVLSKVTDGSGRVTLLDSTSEGALLGITDPSGRRTRFSYDGAQLTSITYPDGNQTKYTYDSNNNLISATNYDGYKVTYTYNAGTAYRVASALEGNTDGTLGGQTTIAYGNNMTSFTDVKGRKDVFQFNNFGNTVSTTDSQGNANYTQYKADKNKASVNSKTQKTTANYLLNHNAEVNSDWNQDCWGTAAGTCSYTAEAKYMGSQSLKVQKTNSNDRLFYNQTITSLQKGGTYTFSAYEKTSGISNTAGTGAEIFVNYQDSAGNWQTADSKCTNGTNDWQRVEVTFKLPSDAASTNVFIRAGITGESGTAYFDCLQLEDGSVSNRYNLIENGDFRNASLSFWNKSGDCDSNDGLAYVDPSSDPNYSSANIDGNCFKINGVPNKSKNLYQTINASGAANETFVISGWAKADSVPFNSDRYFALDVGVVGLDNSTQWIVVPFNQDSSSWQYVSSVVKTDRAYKSITVYGLYYNNANAAYFDGFRLYKEEFGNSYAYDAKGNLTSSTDVAKQNSTFAYNTNNDLVTSTDPKSSQFKYEYDNNDTTAKKHDLTKATSAENVVYSFSYDSSGNPLTSKVGDSTNFINSSATYTASGNYLNTLTDSMGNTVTNNWDEQKGILNNVTDAKGKTTSYGYDGMDRLTSVSKTADSNVVSNSYGYKNDKINTITQNGFNYNFGYDSLGNNTTVAAGSQNLITNNYEERTGKLLESTYGNGQKTSTLYDGNDRTIGKVYGADNPQGITYSGNIQNVGIKTVSGNGTLLGTVGQSLRLESLAIGLTNLPAGMHIKYQAQVQNIGWQNWVADGATAGTIGQGLRMEAVRIKLEGAPAGYTVQYQVQVQNIGWMNPVQDGAMAGTVGQSLRIEAIKITVVKQRSSYEYDASGNLGYQNDIINGTSYRYTYDIANRPVKTTDSKGNTLSYTYDANNNKNKVSENINGSTYDTSYGFNKDNQPTSITYNRATANTVSLAYDTLGRNTSKTINTGSGTYNTVFGFLPGINGSTSARVGSITNNGAAISYTYDANGNIESINQNSTPIKYYYNELNEVTREDNAVLNKTIVYTYDAGGNITNKTEYPYTTGALGTATTAYPYVYGDTNWKDKLTSYNGKAITYDAIGNPLTYNGNSFTWEEGRQLSALSGNGNTISYKYNDSGIRTEKTVNGVTTKYNIVGDKVTYETNSTNNVYNTYKYNYSQNAIWTYHGFQIPVNTGTSYTYSFDAYISPDANITATGTTLVAGAEQCFNHYFFYDNTKKGTWQHFEYTQTPTSNIAQMLIYPSASQTPATTGYIMYKNVQFKEASSSNNLFGQPSDNNGFGMKGNGVIECSLSNDNSSIYNTYKYDFSQNTTWTYHGFSIPVSTGKSYTYSFDAYISPDANIAETGTTFIADEEQGLANYFYYDNTKKGSWQHFEYTQAATSANSLALMYPSTGQTPATTGYIMYKNVQFKEVGSSNNLFGQPLDNNGFNMKGNGVFQYSSGADNVYYTYDASNDLVSMNLNGVEYYYIRNAQGDIIGLFDKTGAQVVSYTYDTWGKLISIKDKDGKDVTTDTTNVGYKNPYRYRGYRYDSETGLYYLNSRYYSPEWGRFVNADVAGGKVGTLLSHNVFAYCMNNPVNMDDPSGNWPKWSKLKKCIMPALQVLGGLGMIAGGITAIGTGNPILGVIAITYGLNDIASGGFDCYNSYNGNSAKVGKNNIIKKLMQKACGDKGGAVAYDTSEFALTGSLYCATKLPTAEKLVNKRSIVITNTAFNLTREEYSFGGINGIKNTFSNGYNISLFSGGKAANDIRGVVGKFVKIFQ